MNAPLILLIIILAPGIAIVFYNIGRCRERDEQQKENAKRATLQLEQPTPPIPPTAQSLSGALHQRNKEAAIKHFNKTVKHIFDEIDKTIKYGRGDNNGKFTIYWTDDPTYSNYLPGIDKSVMEFLAEMGYKAKLVKYKSPQGPGKFIMCERLEISCR